MYKTLRQIKNLKNKKVLLKVDLNLSVGKNGKIDSDSNIRIKSILNTINFLCLKNAKIIIISYLGRPEGNYDAKYKMDPVAKTLSKYLNGKKIKKLDSCVSKDIQKDIENMKAKDIIMLENIRFYKEEMINDKKFAKELARLFDLYVNDSFSNAHRNHMSSSAITEFLPSYIGIRFEEEIKSLDAVVSGKQKNKVFILGGAKVDTKLEIIKKLQGKFDFILIGGVLANTILKSRGFEIGKSICDEKFINLAKTIKNKKIILPIDALTSKSLENKNIEVKDIKKIEKDDLILDIGPKTIELFARHIKNSKMILWNGPMGYFERSEFRVGTEAILKLIKKYKIKAYTGGGETFTLLNTLKMNNIFSFISTGGGAMLEYLNSPKLPALEMLKKNKFKI